MIPSWSPALSCPLHLLSTSEQICLPWRIKRSSILISISLYIVPLLMLPGLLASTPIYLFSCGSHSFLSLVLECPLPQPSFWRCSLRLMGQSRPFVWAEGTEGT